MNRNRTDRFSNIPTPTMPRTKQDFGVHRRLQTMQHGKLTPFYCRLVYPYSNLKIDMTSFIRMDTSLKVPLDNVYIDHYYFFVPLRIIDPNFEKILGHKDVYDNNTYNYPLLNVKSGNVCKLNHNSLINYLGYGALNDNDALVPSTAYLKAELDSNNAKTGQWTGDLGNINPYPMVAYYKIWNDFFRDENLMPEKPIEDLVKQGVIPDTNTLYAGASLWRNFEVLPVCRYHDIFSSGLVSPIKGASGDVVIPLGGPAPVITGDDHTLGSKALKLVYGAGSTLDGALYTHDLGKVAGVTGTVPSGSQNLQPANLWADLKNSGPTVSQLYLSLALYSLYDKRGTFGTRLIEQIRGSFGLEVPDGLLSRPEYLGGSCQTLNNVPVLNSTGNDLGDMRGNSATLTGLNSFDKGFNEWGFVIGVSATRIKHTYNQGIQNIAFKMFDNLDMYWPEFANISKVGTPNYRIVNSDNSINDEVFNYQEPWIDQHTENDFACGDFGSFRDSRNDDLATKWTYQDIYSGTPTFNQGWLQEPLNPVTRTLTGNMIYGSTNPDSVQGGHQFMIEYKYRVQLTMPIPAYSKVPNLLGRI